MTRAELEAIKSKPHGPDVDRLIQEIEDCWTKLSDLGERDVFKEHTTLEACFKCGGTRGAVDWWYDSQPICEKCAANM